MSALTLSVVQQSTGEGTRRTLRITGGSSDLEIFFDLLGERDIPEPTVLDGFVGGMIFYVMKTGLPLHVQGSMSRAALRNLYEYQSVWARWKPESYKQVEIIPSSIVERITSKPDKAISAYSGGVDSIFTALRHRLGWLGNASYPLQAGLLVQGFDIPLANTAQFNQLIERIQPFADEVGITFKKMRTNMREVSGQYWGDSHLVQLACCLHNFSHEFDSALIGSGQPYNALILPDGTTPITDHLLSGAQMNIVHDGAAYARSEKVAAISKHATAIKVLKVCWEGADAAANCGKCEKCMRTRMNLAASGLMSPPCFATPFDPAMIPRINIKNAIQLNEWSTLYRYVKERGIDAPWVELLEKRIARAKKQFRFKAFKQKVKKILPAPVVQLIRTVLAKSSLQKG